MKVIERRMGERRQKEKRREMNEEMREKRRCRERMKRKKKIVGDGILNNRLGAEFTKSNRHIVITRKRGQEENKQNLFDELNRKESAPSPHLSPLSSLSPPSPSSPSPSPASHYSASSCSCSSSSSNALRVKGMRK
jgi:hypothetical protein